MGIDRAHLTRTLDQLEERNFVTRERLPDNKRAYQIALTREGKKILREVEKILHSESTMMMHGLSASEKSVLDKLINKVKSNIEVELA